MIFKACQSFSLWSIALNNFFFCALALYQWLMVHRYRWNLLRSWWIQNDSIEGLFKLMLPQTKATTCMTSIKSRDPLNHQAIHWFLIACTRLYNPHCPSIGRLVGHTLFFFMILFLWPHCSCPNGLVTSNMAPVHPHATSVAVYPALFLEREGSHYGNMEASFSQFQ